MYTLVRRYIKTGIGFLAFGLLIGGWMLARRELADAWPSPHLVSAHVHAIAVGFVMMMILGVALWLFPRPEREDTRYRPARAEAAYWVVSLSTGLRVVAELSRTASDAPALRWAVVLAGFGQIVGIGLFFHTMWSRIRPVGSRGREERGERF